MKVPLSTKLILSFIINVSFSILGIIIGLIAGSLALFSSAIHNSSDAISLFISFCGQKIAKRKPTAKITYGFGRATILAALINAIILIITSGYILFEAYHRLSEPSVINEWLVIIMGLLGIGLKGIILFILYQERDDLNIRSAVTNTFFDALGSFAAFLTGIIILFTGFTLIDPIVGSLIALMLLYSAWDILRNAVHILLEGVPRNINVENIKKAIQNEPEVKQVDDLHIWAISSRYIALSCHIVLKIKKKDEVIHCVKRIKKMLFDKFNITHATIEVEH